MKPVWKGSISFGLVMIPVQALPATASTEKIKFRMLRRSDLSPIQYKRVAEVDQHEVPWNEIVKGYEYEKGKFVVMEEADFDKVEIDSVDSIAIQQFVDLAQINPMLFDKPYYLEPTKGGAGAYSLLRDVLAEMGKVGIAKVAMRSRQHLAALKPHGQLLVLELMHFASEISPPEAVRIPETKVGAREKEMAKTLVQQMEGEWKPESYTDEYTDALAKLIEKKIAAGGRKLPEVSKRAGAGTNVIDLATILKESLEQAKRHRKGMKPSQGPKEKATAKSKKDQAA